MIIGNSSHLSEIPFLLRFFWKKNIFKRRLNNFNTIFRPNYCFPSTNIRGKCDEYLFIFSDTLSPPPPSFPPHPSFQLLTAIRIQKQQQENESTSARDPAPPAAEGHGGGAATEDISRCFFFYHIPGRLPVHRRRPLQPEYRRELHRTTGRPVWGGSGCAGDGRSAAPPGLPPGQLPNPRWGQAAAVHRFGQTSGKLRLPRHRTSPPRCT